MMEKSGTSIAENGRNSGMHGNEEEGGAGVLMTGIAGEGFDRMFN